MEKNRSLQEGRLLGVQAGRVRMMTMPEDLRVDFRHQNWQSGIFKDTVSVPVRITSQGVPGDEQSDLENHGGRDNAVLAYDGDHYVQWRERLGMPELGPGAFGENFTVRGFSDEDVCIGDVWTVGEESIGAGEGLLRLQVTQARQPCYKLARRLGQPHIVKMVHENSWGGWYMRVLQEGIAEAGMKITLTERKHPDWTVARAVQVMYARKRDLAAARALAALPELSARWKRELVAGDQQAQQQQQ